MTTCIRCRGSFVDGRCVNCKRHEDGTRDRPEGIDAARQALNDAVKRHPSSSCTVRPGLGFDAWCRAVEDCGCGFHGNA